MLYRYNVTNPDGKTLSVVCKDAKQAREKGWRRHLGGAPFLHYSPASLRIVKLEAVEGPAMVSP